MYASTYDFELAEFFKIDFVKTVFEVKWLIFVIFLFQIEGNSI